MVSQYPHTAKITEQTEATYDQTSGTYTGGNEVETQFWCRAEPNYQSKLTPGVDNQMIQYAWIVYLPKDTGLKIKAQTPIEISDCDGEVIAKGNVIRFHEGQLNVRIWL